jgi:ABC-type transport system involved in cytochrome bd biosynthesis fused ATPase/permease subunit
MFAIELLIANIIITFILGFITLVGVRIGIYAQYEATAVLIVLLIVLTIIFSWINIRLLYRFELERFVMKEELRVHNIDLKLGNEELADKMTKLQETTKEYADKLSNQEKYKDVTSNLE